MTLNNTPDQWSYLCGSVLFSSTRSYKHLIAHHQIHVAFKWLWKSCCQNKRKFFFWLVLQDRLNTRALLKRKHMPLPDYQCVFCDSGIDEDIFHLLFHCPFSLACWSNLQLIIPNSQDVGFIVESIKRQLHLPFSMEVLITMCWSIWSMRNDVIFRNIPHSVNRCKQVFKKEFALVILRAKAKYQPHIDLWLQSFV